MKTKKTFIICIIAIATIGLSLNSCKKDNTSTTDTAGEQAGVNAGTSATASEMIYDDAFDVVSQSSEQSNISVNAVGGSATTDAVETASTAQPDSYTTTAGATITLVPADPTVFPKTMTIDYGTGVTASNGIIRKGQIVVNLSGPLRVAGSVISVTFNNYSVNAYQLTGTYAMTPQIVAGGGVNYNISITNGSITFPSGTVAAYSGTETFTQTGGIGTSSITDDTYQITGNFSYSNSSSGSISGTITSPLIKSADCKDITMGTVAFVYKGLNGKLDFGSGACDNLATVTFGKTTSTITLAR